MRIASSWFIGCAALLLLGGCSHRPPCTDGGVLQRPWRTAATEDDRKRLSDWRTAWLEALDKARKAGHGSAIDREGDLLVPDLVLADPLPPPGDYRCRMIKIGAIWSSVPEFMSYPPVRCHLSPRDHGLRFTVLEGAQRPRGNVYRDNGERGIFLGTMVLGDEHKSIGYGLDRDRDMAGIVQRVDARRWRIAFPRPHWESTLDVMELTPAG